MTGKMRRLFVARERNNYRFEWPASKLRPLGLLIRISGSFDSFSGGFVSRCDS